MNIPDARLKAERIEPQIDEIQYSSEKQKLKFITCFHFPKKLLLGCSSAYTV